MNSPDSSRDISIKQEEPEDHSHLDILHMVVCEEEVSPKQERSHCLLQEELEPPHIKEEEEELLKRPEEPAGSMLTLLPVKIEDGDEDISSRSFEVEVELESESESEVELESDTELTEDRDDCDETSGDILHMVVCKEVSPKQERSHRLLQEELEPPHIKDEEEELLKRPEEPAGSMLTLLAEVEVEVEVESDTELTEDDDDRGETSGQSASNTISMTRKNQGDSEEQRSYSLNCAQSIQRNIWLIMQDASEKKPRPIMPRSINVICASALGSSNVPVINIPLVLASNGHHYGSLIQSSECQQVTTYNQPQLQTQANAQHTIDVPIVSQHQPILPKHTSDTAFPQQTHTVLKSKTCKKCKQTFKNLLLHLRRSSECQNYGIDSLQNKNDAEKLTTSEQQQLHTQAKAQHTIDVPIVSKHPTEVEQLHTQAKAHSKHRTEVEVCKQCHKRFLHLNMHLSKSLPCQSYYYVHSLQKKVHKHVSNRQSCLLYRQRKLKLQTQANAQHTIDVPIVSKHHPTEVEVCKQCHKRFLNVNMHLSKSPPCQSYYGIQFLQRNAEKNATSNRQKCKLYRQRQLQAQAHCTIDTTIVPQNQPNLEVCKQCHSHFRYLNKHLCRSPPCRTYYICKRKVLDKHYIIDNGTGKSTPHNRYPN